MKGLIKKALPGGLVSRIQKYTRRYQMRKNYRYDYRRYNKYSASEKIDTAIKLLGRIIWDYHSIEKGLTMPEFRAGFGQPKLHELIDRCERYARLYNKDDEQLKTGAGVVFEYLDKHREIGFELDAGLVAKIEQLKKNIPGASATAQIKMGYADYFAHINDPFPLFSESRKSIRHFSATEDVPEESLLKAIDLARNAPSACNRQTARTHLFLDKDKVQDVLKNQNGNRGFGHLASKLIVITAEMGVFKEPMERYQTYIDGGIFAMNLLYALHYYKVGACILNCSHNIEKDLTMSAAVKAKPSEVFVAMIACGVPADDFSIARSKRSSIDFYNTIH